MASPASSEAPTKQACDGYNKQPCSNEAEWRDTALEKNHCTACQDKVLLDWAWETSTVIPIED